MAGNENSGKAKFKVIRDALMLAMNDDESAPVRTTLDSIIRAHVKKAKGGDIPAIKEIYDRIDGKVAQAIVGGDEGDSPVRMLVQRIELVAPSLNDYTKD